MLQLYQVLKNKRANYGCLYEKNIAFILKYHIFRNQSGHIGPIRPTAHYIHDPSCTNWN